MLACGVGAALSVLALGIVGRRLERRLAIGVAAVAVLVPSAFEHGVRTWADAEAERMGSVFRAVTDHATTTVPTTTKSTGTAPHPSSG